MIQPVIALQNELAEKMAVVKQEFEVAEDDQELNEQSKKRSMTKKAHIYATKIHIPARRQFVNCAKKLSSSLQADEEEDGPSVSVVKEIFAHLMKNEVRRGVLEDGIRPDERGPEDIRPLSSEVGMLPRAHGSSIFTRGLTQAVNVVTLASASFAQVIDTMERDEEKHFIHHYNFRLLGR